MKSLDEKFHICETCHKHLDKNEIPCQAVAKNGFRWVNFEKKGKNLISKKISFKEIAIMYSKGEFSNIRGRFCNILIEVANIYNILLRSVDYNGLMVVKLKQDLKYKGHVYF